jgi:hypothetical protein
MAIKGKGKSKRRGVAAAPKPVYVKPHRPLLARRGFQIGALAVIAVGAIVGVTLGLIAQHSSNQKKALNAAEASIVQRFGRAIDDSISGIGQPFQTQFRPFPDLTSDVSKLKAGTLTPADAIKEGDKWSAAALAAQTSIQKVPTATLIQGHADLVDLSDAQNMLVDALGVYQQTAEALKLTAEATGAQQAAMLAHTESLLGVSGRLFGDGYQKLINERNRFNLLIPTAPQPSPSVVIPIPSVSIGSPSPAVSPSAGTSPSGGAHGGRHTHGGKHKKKK